MFKHIVVPVDGSATANRAIDKALAVVRAFDSDVTLIHVIDPYALSGAGAEPSCGQAQYLGAATAQAHEALEAAHADLLVMGSHPRHGLEKLVLGSVTAQVLSHAHLSVLVVCD